MKTILLIGGTGFIGRNVLPELTSKYNMLVPKRAELNTVDEESVDSYFKTHKIDVVIHCASSNPAKNPLDKAENFEKDIISGFENVAAHAAEVQKILYLGSGADMDKRRDLKLVKEEEFGKFKPDENNSYANAKYKITQEILKSKNIYNLRIWGCYGPTDAKTKFIRDAIDCCLENRAITIRQNCMFDYMYVEDLAYIFEWFIENEPKYHDYNICTAKPVSLLEIAQIVAQKMGNDKPIEIAKDGWNLEYTADNSRLLQEFNFTFTTLEEGIEKQIKWQKGACGNVN